MFSRRTQWIIASVALVGIILFSAASEDAEETATAATGEVAQMFTGSLGPGGSAGAAAAPQAVAGTGGRAHLQDAQIIDARGFSEPLLAYTIKIPANWQVGGGVVWNPNAACHGDIRNLDWAAHAPDGRTSFGVQRGLAWQNPRTALPTDPCPLLGITTAREFLEAVAQADRPGARILDYREATEASRRIREEIDAAQAQRAARGEAQEGRGDVDSGQLLIGWNEGGTEMREVLQASVLRTVLHRDTYSVSELMRMRAPDGQLDLALFDQIAGSVKPDPRWSAAATTRGLRQIQHYFDTQRGEIMLDHQRKMAAINARGMADRHQIRMQAQQDIAGIYASTHANTMATNEGMHRRSLGAIGEYNSYNGTGGTVVQHSIHAPQRVFQHADFPDRIVSSDDPWAQPPSGYVEIQQVR